MSRSGCVDSIRMVQVCAPFMRGHHFSSLFINIRSTTFVDCARFRSRTVCLESCDLAVFVSENGRLLLPSLALLLLYIQVAACGGWFSDVSKSMRHN